jgi:hypothetical protein
MGENRELLRFAGDSTAIGESVTDFLTNNMPGISRLRVTLGVMIPLPKPRGFSDYGLFALLLTVFLDGLFWLEASDGVGLG